MKELNLICQKSYEYSNVNTRNIIVSRNESNTPEYVEDGDYLSDQEIAKIKYFYSSMSCYVYVNRSIAELYQMKRDNVLDELDNDPVNDYKLYMERVESRREGRFNDGNNNNDTNIDEIDQRNVNYMYINSGVPVIVFNYDNSSVREKDLRILLVERSTGFCMWQFKFDWLTHFENDNNITVVRLAFNNKISNHIVSNVSIIFNFN